MSVNFYDLCRVCTANSEQKIHIFSAEGKRKNLNSKIAECLALNIEEKDRLPKVLCSQCLQHVEKNMEFRDICKKSQMTLVTWLNSAANNGPKVYIKDAISTSSGKSLSVLGSSATTATTFSAATTTSQIPMVTYTTTPTVLQGNNEMLNSIVQVAGLQQTIELNQNADKQQTFPQYTITVDKAFNRGSPQTQQQSQSQSQHTEKDTKANALEEFLKLKPNIKVTPIRKESQKQQQEQPQNPMQQETHQHHIQTSQPQQITVQAQQIALPAQAQATALPQQISQLQLQQLIQQQLQQQWQQQQLQQQLQQLSSQFHPQQITITAPASAQTGLTPSAAITPNTSLSDSLSPSKSKKPKLNFVLTPPSGTPAQNTFQQLTATNTAAPTAQPQIQLQFQPSTQQLQPLQQQQQTTANAANLLTNLAPLLQQSVNMTAPLSAASGTGSLLSPNKCFLPITIKDENSDQQIVAHIDAKNFVFPTTYQLQMKLQPQIATVDGQPIMQLTPTSIPATLQLTPQALTNQTFQALLNTNNLQQPQIIQQMQQQQPNQQQEQQQSQQLQFAQSTPPTNTLQITSNQVLRQANGNDAVATTTEQQENVKPKTQIPNTISQRKFKITQLPGNAFEITPTNDDDTTTTTKTPVALTPVQQKITPPRQQQTQQQQLQQTQNQTTIPTSLPTQYGGITVQRISTATKMPSVLSAQKSQDQQQQLSQVNKSTLKIETATTSASPSKTNVWQKQNLTISRIPAQPQQQQQQQQQLQQKQVTTSAKPLQQNQKLLVQPQSTNSPKKMQPHQTTTQQQNQHLQLTEQEAPNQLSNNQQQSKKLVRRVVGKNPVANAAATANKQETHKNETTAAIIEIESIQTLPKTRPLTPSSATTSTTTATPLTTRVSIKKGAPPKSNAQSAEDNNAITTAAAGSASMHGFECGQCHRIFKKKEHLTQHVKLHAGIRPFKCTQAGCDKDFSRKEHLLRHIVSHSGEKQFSCDVCEKPFSRKDNLNKHRRIHTSALNSSNYICEICNKTFTIKSHFEEHRTLHAKQETETITQTKKPIKTQQRTVTVQQQQQPQQNQHIQFVQHQPTQQQQQQTMHLQLPTVVTTQDLAGNTITITQSADPNKSIGNHDATVFNLPSHLAGFVQLGQAQFVDAATGQIVSHIKINK